MLLPIAVISGAGGWRSCAETATYTRASFARLVALGAFAMVTDPNPMAALLVFEGSSFVPVLLRERCSSLLQGHWNAARCPAWEATATAALEIG